VTENGFAPVNLISRYLFREISFSCVLVLVVMFVILMSNQFAEILGDAAANELPRDAVFTVFGLTALRYLTLIAPIAVFIGIMLALARLNRDAETSALYACGIGPANMLVPVGFMVAFLASVTGWLTLVSAPDAMRRIEEIKFAAQEELELGVLEPGRFIAQEGDDTVFYAERVDGEFIYDVFWSSEIENRVVVIIAERGERIEDPETGALSFVLYNGTRTEGIPGQLDFSVIEFGEHGLPVRDTGGGEFEETIEMYHLAALLDSSDPQARAELQWRMSAPVSLIVLALLAVPLSRASPREGRYARIGVGLLIYITYANLLSIGRVWVERDEIPAWLGIWWVHLALAMLALLLFGRDAGWFAPRPRARAAT
jgi:lipopolysaccharide export system permease protein